MITLNDYTSLYLEQNIFAALPILCIEGLEIIYLSEYFLNQSVHVLPKSLGVTIFKGLLY